jgi:predicted small lipoprotein YifL
MKFTTLAALLLILFLAGCGQSGPLYIPGEPASTEPPATQAESAEDSEKDNEDSSQP